MKERVAAASDSQLHFCYHLNARVKSIVRFWVSIRLAIRAFGLCEFTSTSTTDAYTHKRQQCRQRLKSRLRRLTASSLAAVVVPGTVSASQVGLCSAVCVNVLKLFIPKRVALHVPLGHSS